MNEIPQPRDSFQMTERELLYDRVSDARFIEILADESTHIHDIALSTNNYGEFMFIMLSRPRGEIRDSVTFFGLGYHEFRERWIVDEWQWYAGTARTKLLEQRIPLDEATAAIEARRAEVVQYDNPSQ